MQNKYYLALVC